MKFYDREIEVRTLREIEEISREASQFTVITGRRRTGKTTLLKHAYSDNSEVVYFFVARKSETLLCDELVESIRISIGEDLGQFTSFARLFAAIMALASRRHLTLILDEFQNFKYVNESVFSEIQNIWDSSKDSARINLIVCGSLYSMMTRIFDDRKEPLYGRATARIRLKAFPLATLKEILSDYNLDYKPDDLLTLYMLTGGVAKYVEQLITRKAYTKAEMIKAVLSFGSYFINEGHEVLSDEFGKDYGNYFSVISAIASGFNERGEIKSYTGIEAGGYLDKLEKTYDLVYRYRPYMASINSQTVKYGIKDNFLNFWFRYIYKYRSAVEIGDLDFVRTKVESDFDTYSGMILERYFRQKFRETGRYNEVTNYWERGGRNEIDLVAVNDLDHEIVIAEVKRNARRISIAALEQKAVNISLKRHGWNISYLPLSLEDM